MESKVYTTHITDYNGILRELIRSKESGNVIAISAEPFGHLTYLTAVEDIRDFGGDIVEEKVVILKKVDLEGKPIDNNQLFLSDITKIQPFHTKYNERLSTSEPLYIVNNEDSDIKIRCHEQVISFQELKLLLFTIKDSGYRIKIKQFGGKLPYDTCYVKGFAEDEFETIIVSCEVNTEDWKEIPVQTIETVEFESFLRFKGLYSKLFRVRKHVDLVSNNTYTTE